MLKFNREKLRESHEGFWLVIDFIMLGLLIINLVFILFDALYMTDYFRATLDFISPSIADVYQPLNNNFILIDLTFVSIFFTEFCVRWLVSIKRQEYLRWYFFPFIHWYDLIGCIPLGATRMFRFLRIFSIIYRLHKYKIVDLTHSKIFQFIAFYYDVFIEELSDRIVVKVLSDAQKDLRQGSPLVEEIATRVIATRKDTVSLWLSSVLTHAGHSIEDEKSGMMIRDHVKESVSKAVRENAEVSRLKIVPVLGSTIEQTLESAVADIVIQSVIHLLKDMSPQKINYFMTYGVTASLFSEENALDKEILAIVDECIELLKSHVSTQRWKTHFDQV
ncbi:ion transporter [Alkalimarinus alittae]|uniref:Ion transporter n=1 Tax=Alkalimarinus alittae TaxID=2961619 RepID=A0ABY6MYZ9_9ALTE|nr:ion transporter [Alkalimarinus alittae]UZE95012.1 ion transporter [Alkalimarinus alittae]